MKPTKFRWVLAWMMFLLSFLSYMDRVNLSVATPAIMNEFSFSKVEIGLLQTAFFVGYALMQIPGGMMGEWFGSRRVVAGAVTWWSLFTALTAFCSSIPGFMAVRCLFGMGEGPLPPAMNSFIYRWFHKAEKGLAYSFNLGGAFIGPVFGPVVTVFLMLQFGWRSVFLLFGAAGIVFVALWLFLARETPEGSRFVNEAELAHIREGMDPKPVSKELAPWRQFLSSRQFWAIGLQYFITDYIMFVFLAWLPLYLMEAQNFSLQKMGIAAAFPWAALCVSVMTSAYVSDKLTASGCSKKKSRSAFAMLGLVVCCVSLYMAAVASDPWKNVVWLTISLGALGLPFSCSWAACTDIGGRFTGSVSGWMNFWGNVGGALAPICTAWIASNFGWQAAIMGTAFSALIGVAAWLLVNPDRQMEEGL